ncbi:MAG: inositol monophosphatase [Chloroflexi bacterium]|nr:inositol monophosphatase [Chloroflexota bacterium]
MGRQGLSDGGRRHLIPFPPDYFLERLTTLERRLREAVLGGRDTGGGGVTTEASAVARDATAAGGFSGDTIYAIDERGEAALHEFCDTWARDLDRPFVLVCEGLPEDGRQSFPAGGDPADAVFECIVDPIDGTRGLMYEKRSAWILAAVAPGAAVLGRRPRMSDIFVAVQMELPTTRARLADTLWAVAGRGAAGETVDLVTGTSRPLRPLPSQATGIAHSFATIAKFFPGTKELAAWLEERLFAAVVGDHAAGAPLVFDDEYISSGGQLYEIMVGHDRFVADLRPALIAAASARRTAGADRRVSPAVRRLCARPYDLCTELIAREAGVVVTDAWGRPLDAPLDTTTDLAWIGYANRRLRASIEPHLQALMREIGVPAPE